MSCPARLIREECLGQENSFTPRELGRQLLQEAARRDQGNGSWTPIPTPTLLKVSANLGIPNTIVESAKNRLENKHGFPECAKLFSGQGYGFAETDLNRRLPSGPG